MSKLHGVGGGPSRTSSLRPSGASPALPVVRLNLKAFQLSNYIEIVYTLGMKTASSEIRAVVIKAHGAGIPRQQIADIVGYHLNSVSRWIREFERENRLEAHPRGHRASIFPEAERREIVELIGKQPDITLEELRSHFTKACSLNAIHKLLKSLGFVVKKDSTGKRARTRGYNPGQSRADRVSKNG